MADPIAQPADMEQRIERYIKIYLEQAGAQDVARGLKTVKDNILLVRKSAKDLGDTTLNLTQEMQRQSKAYVQNEKAAAKALKSTQKQTAKTVKSFINLGGVASGAFKAIEAGLRSLSGLGGFDSMVKAAVDYDKTLLSLSSQVNRLGIGINSLNKKMIGISKSMTLTKKETMSLFSSFEQGFAIVSLSDFESLLERIQMMVGSNEEAINRYKDAVGGLSQKYVGLAQRIARLGKDASESDKQIAAGQLKRLWLLREIGDAEYRNNMAVIKGNKQTSPDDEKTKKVAEARIKTLQEFNQHIENVKLGLGRTILPALQKIANWLDRITEGGEKWGRGVAATVALLLGLKLAGGGIGRLGSLAMSGMLGGAGRAAGAGGGLAVAASQSVTALSGFSIALLKSTAVIGAAIIGWKLGKAVYKNVAEPWMEKNYEENAEKDTWTRRILLMVGGGVEKDPNAERGRLAKEARAPHVAKARKAIVAEELKVAQALEKQVALEKELADALEEKERRQKEMGAFAKDIGDLAAAESDLLSAQIERMQLTGKVDEMSLIKGKKRVFASLDAEAAATKEYIEGLKKIEVYQSKAGNKGKTIKEMVKTLNLSEEVAKTLKDQNYKLAGQVKAQTEVRRGEAILVKITRQRQEVVEKINRTYEAQISYQGVLADKASLLVQIADSYAIGVGASAQMRIQEFNALEDQRKEMEKNLQLQKALLAEQSSEDARLKQVEVIAKTENEILQLQLKQAGITKSLRDGWIEAIGSMNTGAGTFTKIIMDQNKGTAQSLKLAGQAAIISSRSGALGGGYRTTEKFSTMQGVAGQGLITGAGGKRNQAYQTTMDMITGSNAEGLQWRARQRFQRDLSARNKYAASGGLAATAFGASPHYEGIVGEGGAPRTRRMGSDARSFAATAEPIMSDRANGVIKIDVNLRGNAVQVSQEIARAIGEKISNIVNNASAHSLDGVKLK